METNLKCLFILLLLLIALWGVGSAYGPSSLFEHPVITAEMWIAHPIGSHVVPINEPSTRWLFKQDEWMRDDPRFDAEVVDYVVTHYGETQRIYLIKTHRGEIISVHADWVASG